LDAGVEEQAADMSEPVLRRKILRPRSRAAAPPAAPLSAPATVLPRALVRAISAGAGLTARAGPLTERSLDLAEALDRLDDDGFLALLAPVGAADGQVGGASALLVLDPALFSALIEALTIGRLAAPQTGPARRPTATDAALLGAVVDRLLAELARGQSEAAPGVPAGAGSWQMARALSDPRLLGAILDEGRYLMIEVPLTLSIATGAGAGAGAEAERAGALALLLPVETVAALPSAVPPLSQAAPPPGPDAFARGIEVAVMAAPAVLTAVLGRLSLPIARVCDLAVGERLELPLSALEEVALVGPSDQIHATARLGQARGMRAVRILTLGEPGSPGEGVPFDASLPGALLPDPAVGPAAGLALRAPSAA
jgi:flagellar motor switch protein FliM